jgi:hypothetical protein
VRGSDRRRQTKNGEMRNTRLGKSGSRKLGFSKVAGAELSRDKWRSFIKERESARSEEGGLIKGKGRWFIRDKWRSFIRDRGKEFMRGKGRWFI